MIRDEKIDLLKGIAIILVLIGHAIQQTSNDFLNESIIAMAIYSFHMHMFFFLSGYIISDKAKHLNVLWVGKQFISLIIPIIVWKFITAFFQSKIFTINDIIDIFSLWLKDPRGNYWFLWLLFLCEMCFFIQQIFLCNISYYKQIVIDAIFILLLLITTHIFDFDWGGIDSLYMYLLFYFSGYYTHVFKEKTVKPFVFELKVYKIVIWSSWLIVFWLHCFITVNYPANIFNSSIVQFFYRIIIAYLGIAVCWTISDYMHGKIRITLARIGHFTKEIYIVHIILMPYITIGNSVFFARVSKVLFSLFISLLISWMIRNNIINTLLFGNYHSVIDGRKHCKEVSSHS